MTEDFFPDDDYFLRSLGIAPTNLDNYKNDIALYELEQHIEQEIEHMNEAQANFIDANEIAFTPTTTTEANFSDLPLFPENVEPFSDLDSAEDYKAGVRSDLVVALQEFMSFSTREELDQLLDQFI